MKKLLTILAAVLLLLSAAACSSSNTPSGSSIVVNTPDSTTQVTPAPSEEPDPLQALVGYYELSGMVSGGEETSQDTIDALKKEGLIVSLEITEDGKALLNVLGEVTELTVDAEAMTMTTNGMNLSFTAEDGDITIAEDDTSMTFSPAEKPAETPAPAITTDYWTEDTKTVGYEDIGFFSIPQSWEDISDTAAITLQYVSPDRTYSVSTYSYTKEEWSSYGDDYGALDVWLDYTARGTAEEYADILDTEEYNEITFKDYDAVRGDLTFTDDSALTNIIFKDEEETIHIFTFETFDEASCAQMPFFIDVILADYRIK